MPVKARKCQPCPRGGGAADKSRPASSRCARQSTGVARVESKTRRPHGRHVDGWSGQRIQGWIPVRSPSRGPKRAAHARTQSGRGHGGDSQAGGRGEFPPSRQERHELVPEGFEQEDGSTARLSLAITERRGLHGRVGPWPLETPPPTGHLLPGRPGKKAQSPVVPSVRSRRKSAWPLWRAYSWIINT